MRRTIGESSASLWESVVLGLVTALALWRMHSADLTQEAWALGTLFCAAAGVALHGVQKGGLALRKCQEQGGVIAGAMLVPLVATSLVLSSDETDLWLVRFWTTILHSWWFVVVALLGAGNQRIIGGAIVGLFAYSIRGPEGVPASALHPMLLQTLVTSWTRSFTYGEAAITASAVSSVLSELVATLSGRTKRVHAAGSVVQCAVLAVFCAAVGVVPLAKRVQKVGSFKFVAGIVAVVVFITYPALYMALRSEPIKWALQFVFLSSKRLGLVMYCAVLLIVALYVFPPQRLPLRTIVARKYYHALALAMFLPTLFLDPEFLRVAFGVALGGLFVVELLCIAEIPPVGIKLNRFMSSLSDKRDRGVVTMSHLYLLLGCAFPVWLDGRPCGPGTLYGLLSLGLYDATASAVGSAYGKTRIARTRKTVEGTLAGVFAALMVCTVCEVLVCRRPESMVVHVPTLLSMSAFEVVTTQNDNLVLPLFSYAVANLLSKG